MSDPFAAWTVRVVLAGLFLIFLVHFLKFVHGEVWPVVSPLFRRRRERSNGR